MREILQVAKGQRLRDDQSTRALIHLSLAVMTVTR